MSQTANRIRNISNLIRSANKNIRKAQVMLESLEEDMKSSFDDVPGVLGVFDGENMIAADGKTYEVNPNYAAKSVLVEGDNLKMVEENGKQMFKQVTKVPRKEVKGVLNKKEGKWYALTEDGTFKVLDVAVDFRRGEVNDEVEVLIPENEKNAKHAALVKLSKEDERPVIDEEKAKAKAKEKEEKGREKGSKTEKKSRAPEKSVPKKKAKPKSKPKTSEKKSSEKKPAEKKSEENGVSIKEDKQIESIFEEDDLV